ncbi:MAG: serine hydrolase [Bacteroidota bacterium]
MPKRLMQNILKGLLLFLGVIALLLLAVFVKIKPHIHNQAAHNSKILCSAHFNSKRSLEEAWENSIRIKLPGDHYELLENGLTYTSLGITRKSVYIDGQGCTALPKDFEGSLPARSIKSDEKIYPALERIIQQELQDEISEHFEESAAHVASIVIQDGAIIAEKYQQPYDKDTKFESWSMGKSLTATLIGRLIQQNRLSLHQKAPIKEWANDERASITIANLLNMSSGLKFSTIPRKNNGEMDLLAMLSGPLPDHIAVYSGLEDVFSYSLGSELEFPPNTVRRYRNCDPLSLGAILRRNVEAAGEDYASWPQKNIFDLIGTDDFVLERDVKGNFILTGFDYGTAEAWSRLGLLYLNDGIWEGEQILPYSFVRFVQTPVANEENSEYGGQFWLNTRERFPLPQDAYSMSGDGGQHVIIIPSYNAVVVRFGHINAAGYRSALSELLALIDKHLKKGQVEVTQLSEVVGQMK